MQRSRRERIGSGRADTGADHLGGSTDSGQCRGSSKRGMEQEALFEGARTVRPVAWNRGGRSDRIGGRRTCVGVRDADPRAGEPAARRRRPGSACCGRSDGAANTRRACRAERLPHPARPRRCADQGARQSRHSGAHAPRRGPSSTRRARTSWTKRRSSRRWMRRESAPSSTCTTGEPASGEARFDSPLARHPGVYGTHHIGASTDQAQLAVADGVARVIAAFVDGKVINCVNAATVAA